MGRATQPMCSGDRHAMSLFADELVEVYPEVISKSRSLQQARTNPDQAKVVLVQRNIESYSL